MQRPTAVPRIPASASGVSTQRSAPKRSRRPAVARKTPPDRPTSSPRTNTESSRASSVWKQSLIASIMSSSATGAPENTAQLGEIARERRWRVHVRVLEHEPDVGVGLRLSLRDSEAHRLERLCLDLRLEVVVQHGVLAEIPLVASEALVALLRLDALEVDVRAWIVSRRVRRRAVAHRLDECWTVAVARTPDRLARRLEDCKHVAAVDAHAGNAVA